VTAAVTPLPHRPYPPPTTPWVGHMVWSDLCFAHWPLDPEVVRRLVPAALALDTWEGAAWLTIAAFRMEEVHLRHLPPVPGHAVFPELNLRTYVTVEDRPGVFFFSLDVARRLVVAGARAVFGLPYFLADVGMTAFDGAVHFRSDRRPDRRAPETPPAGFEARYRGVGSVHPPSGLERWLVDRYCLYTVDARGVPFRAEVDHAPWPLQMAELELRRNTLGAPFGLELAGDPSLVHFAQRLDVVGWRPQRVG
jgi:uncharacterized protein